MSSKYKYFYIDKDANLNCFAPRQYRYCGNIPALSSRVHVCFDLTQGGSFVAGLGYRSKTPIRGYGIRALTYVKFSTDLNLGL